MAHLQHWHCIKCGHQGSRTIPGGIYLDEADKIRQDKAANRIMNDHQCPECGRSNTYFQGCGSSLEGIGIPVFPTLSTAKIKSIKIKTKAELNKMSQKQLEKYVLKTKGLLNEYIDMISSMPRLKYTTNILRELKNVQKRR